MRLTAGSSRIGFRFIIPLILILPFAACAVRKEAAPFSLAYGNTVRTSVSVEAGTVKDWSRLEFSGPENGEYSLPAFGFDRPVVFKAGNYLRIRFTVLDGGESPSLALLTEENRVLKTVVLPGRKNVAVVFGTQPGDGKTVTGFRLSGRNPSTLRIENIGVTAGPPAVVLSRNTLEISDEFVLVKPSTESSENFSLTWKQPAPGSGLSPDVYIRIETEDADTDGAAEITLRDSKSGREKTFTVNLNPSSSTLSFPKGLTGFTADAAEFRSEVPIERAEAGFLPAFEAAPSKEYDPRMVPIPADQGAMLLYDRSSWRRPDFELFSWNVFPGVLVFDFSDYAVQARFFARLGFFTAVTGEAGKIEEESYYEGRHSYNAHDYRPEDLAAFFQLAEKSGRKLNAQEKFLSELCLERGIVRKNGLSWLPGTGAVLSVSRETSPLWLRKRLLTHESDHGLFYAVKAYRDECYAVWNALADYEREFFLVFLGNKGRLDGRQGYDGYDPGNEYLIVNEMQAHVLQLEPRQVEDYFGGYLERMKRMVPEEAVLLRRVELDDGFFSRVRENLESAMYRTTGIRRADFYAVRSERE